MATNNYTYRQDEIVLIYASCNSLPELDKANAIIGYLNTLEVQDYQPVISELRYKRETELIKKINHGKNNNNRGRG